MKKLLTIILALLPVLAFSQIKYDSVRVVKPQNFVEALSIDTAIVQIISQKAGVNRRVNFQTVADWILAQQPNLDSAQYANDTLLLFYGADTILAIIPSGTIDTAYLSGDTLGIVFAGDTTEVSLAGISADSTVFATLYALADTASAIRGDFPAPDGNGIYSGSGTVPASTWVEQLGSLIFDIDSLGSFTIGDIDEKNTGAIISVSNSGGNDGQINIRSGSGAGYTDATVVVNNYSMPGTTPSGEGLPTGDYMWIVSQGGIRKGQDSTGWIHIDSLLNGYTTGSGTPGTLPIWSSSTALGNSSLTEASGVLSSSLTGALKLPAGTDAQDPVWSAGMLRYNTTANGLQGYDGTAERYLPWADADNWAANRIPYSDGSKLISSANFTYSGTQMAVNTTPATGMELTVSGNIYGTQTIVAGNGAADVGVSLYGGTGGTIGIYRGSGVNGEQVKITNHTNAGSEGHTAFYGSSLRARIGKYQGFYGVMSYTILELGVGSNLNIRTQNLVGVTAPGSVYIWPGSGLNNSNGGSTYIRGGALSTPSATDVTGTTGSIYVQLYYDHNTPDSATTVRTMQVFRSSALTTNWEVYRLEPTTSGIRTLTMESDTVKYRIENLGSISTSTDGSGDIVVAHGMGVTPTVVDIQFTGTSGSATPYVYVVLTDGTDATNFTIRVFDMTGAAVTSTAVTATWHAKT